MGSGNVKTRKATENTHQPLSEAPSCHPPSHHPQPGSYPANQFTCPSWALRPHQTVRGGPCIPSGPEAVGYKPLLHPCPRNTWTPFSSQKPKPGIPIPSYNSTPAPGLRLQEVLLSWLRPGFQRHSPSSSGDSLSLCPPGTPSFPGGWAGILCPLPSLPQSSPSLPPLPSH